jgi:hypothetical protein
MPETCRLNHANANKIKPLGITSHVLAYYRIMYKYYDVVKWVIHKIVRARVAQ